MSRIIHKSILNEECSIAAAEPVSSPLKNITFKTPVKVDDKETTLEKDFRKAAEEGLCPCVIRKGTVSKICQRPVKANGRCGFHKTTCNLPEQKQELPRKRNSLEEEVEFAITNNLCSCITRARSGERKVCGNKVKLNGKCGIHQKKCITADEIAKRKPVNIADEESDDDEEIPSPKLKVIELSKAVESGTCPCILTSKIKAGEDIKICGKKIKANGKCGIHQKRCELPEILTEVKVSEPETILDDLDDFEDEVQISQEDLHKSKIDVSPEVAVRPRTEWNFVPVADIEDVLNYMKNLEQKPSFNILDLSAIDEQISKCLSV
jgi:hypothetical protein